MTLSTVDSLAHFDGPWLVVLRPRPTSTNRCVHRFDTTTGKGKVIAEFPSVAREMSSTLVLRDFAVDPDLLTTP